MSPISLPPTSTQRLGRVSRVAVVSYVVCGVVGAFGLFAAMRDLRPQTEVVVVVDAVDPVVDVDARLLVGLWRGDDGWVVLGADGHVAACGLPSAGSSWTVSGNDVVSDGRTLATWQDGVLVVGGVPFRFAGAAPPAATPAPDNEAVEQGTAGEL